MQAVTAQHCHTLIVEICRCAFLILFLSVYTLGLNFPLDSMMFISIKIMCYFHYKVSYFLLEMFYGIPFVHHVSRRADSFLLLFVPFP